MKAETRSNLLAKVKQELVLPEIEPDACVYSRYDKANCRACIDSCPATAWILDDDSLGLDTEACDGCGLCVSACSSGALHIHFPWVIRMVAGRLVALFSCQESCVKEKKGSIPCIHSLGIRQLLLLYNAGIERLLIATPPCQDCSRNPLEGVYERIDKINRLLDARSKSEMKILQRSSRVWLKVFQSDEVVSRGTKLSRREFIRGKGETLRHQMVILDPLNLAETRTIPPARLLNNNSNRLLNWPWVPDLQSNLCNGCDACMKFCPTEALQVIRNEEDSSLAYHILPEACNGCEICSAVCEMSAISIKEWSWAKVEIIKLAEHQCVACGNTFHLPKKQNASNVSAQISICPICQTKNHAANLFQVLDDNVSNHE